MIQISSLEICFLIFEKQNLEKDLDVNKNVFMYMKPINRIIIEGSTIKILIKS